MKAETKGNIVWGLTVAAGVSAGAVIGNMEYYDVHNLEASRAEFQDLQEQQVALDYDRDVIEADLGEGCLRLVNEYVPGGRLEDTPEDTMVNDLLREPGTPCGESSTEVRADVRELMTAETDIIENQEQSELLSEEIADLEDENAQTDHVAYVAVGTVLGAAAGTAAGLVLGVITYAATKDEENKSE